MNGTAFAIPVFRNNDFRHAHMLWVGLSSYFFLTVNHRDHVGIRAIAPDSLQVAILSDAASFLNVFCRVADNQKRDIKKSRIAMRLMSRLIVVNS